jgi:hypothetical protein
MEPDLPIEKALALLRTQLDRLQAFKGKTLREVEAEEGKWCDRTGNIVARTFGDPSRHLEQFYSSLHAGVHNMMGISPAQQQRNLEERVQGFDSFLTNCIEELELDLPSDLKGVYEERQEFQFYADLADIVGSSTKEILLVDPYLDEEHLSLYGQRVKDRAYFRVLVNIAKMKSSAQSALESVGNKLKSSRGSFELRSSADTHDRVLFVDDRAWVIGQSMKDAAKSKATYIVEFNDPVTLRRVYESIWTSAQVIVA